MFANLAMARETAKSFKRMEEVGMKPNRVTFLSILSACSHRGYVEKGLLFFTKMFNDPGMLYPI